MHRSFAAWLSGGVWRAGIGCGGLCLLSLMGFWPMAVAAGAVTVLVLMRQGYAESLRVVALGSGFVALLLSALQQPVGIVLMSVVTILLPAWGIGALLRKTGSLNLCFQLAVLLGGLTLCAVYVLVDDPIGAWRSLVEPLLDQSAERATNAGLQVDQQAVSAIGSATNWGTYVSLWLLTVLGALFLGRWWQSLLEAPGEFGAEFRQLRLGKILGALALLVMVARLLPDAWRDNAPLLDALAWPATIALAFQGLAAVHNLKATGRIGRGWLVTVYVLLFVPLSMLVTVIALAGWGLADNWQRTRTGSV